MAHADLFDEFIKKLQEDKSPEEFSRFLADLMKFSAAEVYFTILSNLSEQDLQEIDKIKDDKEAEAEVIKKFKAKTKMTPEEYVLKLQEKISTGYLFPELHQAKSSADQPVVPPTQE